MQPNLSGAIFRSDFLTRPSSNIRLSRDHAPCYIPTGPIVSVLCSVLVQILLRHKHSQSHPSQTPYTAHPKRIPPYYPASALARKDCSTLILCVAVLVVVLMLADLWRLPEIGLRLVCAHIFLAGTQIPAHLRLHGSQSPTWTVCLRQRCSESGV